MVKTEYFCDICGKPISSFSEPFNQIHVNAFKRDYDSTRICGFQMEFCNNCRNKIPFGERDTIKRILVAGLKREAGIQ